ncbi:MAG: helix-turn-helix domain-containing protein [Lachnospiraceae bacterium]|nr:helix-turn-helix domain-containing protein [Lachnospiraceae bacterium]
MLNNKKNNIKSGSLLGQYLLVFFVTAFVPATVVCFSLFFSFRTLKEEIINSNQAATRLIQQSFDIKINELSNMMLYISENPTLTRYALQNAPIRAIDTLSQLVSLQECLNDIIIAAEGDTTVYSSHGKIKETALIYHSFITDLIGNNYSLQEWAEQLNTVTEPFYWPTNALDYTPKYLYLFSPVSTNFQYNSGNSTRTAALLVYQEFIHDLFRSSQTTMEENVLLLNSNFEVLSFLAPQATTEDIRSICTLLQHSPESVQKGYLESQNDNLVFVSHSPETNLYYVRFLSKTIAYQSIYHTLTLTMIILIFALIIGMLLIFWGTKRSYFPIRTLADWILDKQPEKSDVKNELVLFKQAYEDTFEKNATLSETMNLSMQGLFNHLLTSLIQGNFSTHEAFLNACNNLGIHLNKSYFCVCSILFEQSIEENNESFYDFTQLITIIKSALPDDVYLLVKDMLFSQKAILLFNSDYEDQSYYQSLIADIKKNLLEHAGLITSIGVGSLIDTYEQVGKSYLESVNALDYRMIYGKDCLITPDMYQSHLPEIAYPTEELKRLHTALLACDATSALDSIHRMYKFTKSPGCSLQVAKYVCYDIFSTLKKLPAFSNMGYSSNLSQNLHITRLVDFDTIDDFFLELTDIVKKNLCSSEPHLDESASDIGQQMVQYIHVHCFHYNFQINTMAEHFHISPQHMRKLFKNHAGIGLSDYISHLKLEKCMQLLRETDMSMNEIVVEIGNTDVSGFMRFFKKNTNQTPGQYRKMYRENN